jgi:hypothetical protein
MAPWSTHPLTEMSTKNISLGVKAAGAYSWQPWHFHVPIVYKFWEPELLGGPRASPGLYRYCCNLTFVGKVKSSKVTRNHNQDSQ